ncbi:MAG: hypothetical protein AAGF26_11620 [Cyanobacteria bacterium P01_G01_bin.49]
MKKPELQNIYGEFDHDVANDERYYLVRMTELYGEDYLSLLDEDEQNKNDEELQLIDEYLAGA